MTERRPDQQEIETLNAKAKRSWAKHAPHYDKMMTFFERRFLGRGHRRWACSRASGDVLEVAIGSGLNISYYPDHVRLTGIDLTPEMLGLAERRSSELGRNVDLREADAHVLPFETSTFDSVVCTYSLCNIPDPQRAIREMSRVLRPGGQLILVDHIRSRVRGILWVQKAIEFFSIRLQGEHMTRRPLEQVQREGMDVIERDRLGPGGVVERLLAIKP